MPRIASILVWSAIAAAFIGPGTVTAAASAGAGFGLSLAWAVLFSGVATYVLQEFAARLADARQQPIDPGLRFMPHAEAAYGDVIDLLAIIRESGLPGQRFCFGGIAEYRQYADFPLAPRPDLPADSPECDPTQGTPLPLY